MTSLNKCAYQNLPTVDDPNTNHHAHQHHQNVSKIHTQSSPLIPSKNPQEKTTSSPSKPSKNPNN
jgi:hypothetical protein